MYINIRKRIKELDKRVNAEEDKAKVIVIDTDEPYSKEYTTTINGKKSHFKDYNEYLDKYVYTTPKKRKKTKIIINDLPKNVDEISYPSFDEIIKKYKYKKEDISKNYTEITEIYEREIRKYYKEWKNKKGKRV